ncbi:MAG: hypothetical protein IKY92_01590 [Akkermansia sp.]|nr:hypothetical protein [Akkermansia sp.]
MQEEINKTDRFLLNFRYLVNKTGMLDCEMAEKLGIHKVSFSRYFSEHRIPKRAILEKIATYFEIKYDDLLQKDLAKPERDYICIEHGSARLSESLNADEITAIAVLMSKEQRAYLTAASRKLGLTLEEFILLAAMERAERAIGAISQTNSSAC